jgi:hypothetical protein
VVNCGESKNKRWEVAISALLGCPSIRLAAEKAKIAENTLLNWMQITEFAEQYRQARQAVLNASIARLQAITSDAVQTLHDVMLDGNSPASSRVSSAKSVLEMAVKSRELEEFEIRISELEKQLKEKG